MEDKIANDRDGNVLRLNDLVVIEKLPQNYWTAQDCGEATADWINGFQGAYGLIARPNGEKYYPGTTDWPSWLSRDCSHVNVLSRRLDGDEIISFDFLLPASLLVKIEFNFLLYAVLVDEAPAPDALEAYRKILGLELADIQELHSGLVQGLLSYPTASTGR